jgi:uncharacterized membrane protein YraQ (UPF0718 family)
MVRDRARIKMDISLMIIVILLAVLTAFAYFTKGWSLVFSGLHLSANMVKTIWFRLLLGFLIAGMVQVLVPPEVIVGWMGAGSGFRGILVGTVAGAFTPGGPYVHFPIIAALQNSGAGMGPLAAYITAWALIPIHRTLVWELPFLGHDFVFSRLLVSLLAPIVIGLGTPIVMEAFSRLSFK